MRGLLRKLRLCLLPSLALISITAATARSQAPSVSGQARPATQSESEFSGSHKIDHAIDDLMLQKNLVGVAIGLIQDGKIVYTKGFGKVNIASGVEVTENSVFNWASNSKPVMAVLAMQLVQEHMLDLDQPIVNYLPNLPGHLQKITTRQLLCHQSGIPHYTNGKIISSNEKVKEADELNPALSVNRFILSPLIFEPGSKTDYSSYAYVLLSAVVQSAGGKPIANQLDERIVGPLHLSSFQLDLPRDNQPNWVTAY